MFSECTPTPLDGTAALPQAFRPSRSFGDSPRFSESEMAIVAWPCCSGTFTSLMSSVLSSLTVALAGPTFLPLPSAKCPFPLLRPPPSLLAASAASYPSSSASWSPRVGVTWRGSLLLDLADFPPFAPLHPLPPDCCNFSVSPSLHSVHFSSVFCPCGKARWSAASCLTLLHHRPPSGRLVDSGVEPVETLSCPRSQAAGTFPDPGLQRGLRLPALGIFFFERPFRVAGRGTGKGGQC